MIPRSRSHPRSTLALLAAPVVASAMIAFTPGCYKRVVHADGIGADGIEVKQSNRSNTVLDRAVFGDDTPGKKAANRPTGYTPKQ